ncbi:MAG: hypothetical protein DMD90_03620 [Candidatus Rokuibacteriota bacterium]|nr:MAG: hypothetical protein DMD90_03620 [Candidatus Rokubacteria bacterium]
MHALIVTCLVLVIALTASPVAGQEADALRRELDQMRRGFETMKEQYQKSIDALNDRLKRLETTPAPTAVAPTVPPPAAQALQAAPPGSGLGSTMSPTDLLRPREPFSLYGRRGSGQLLFDMGIAGDFVGSFAPHNVQKSGAGTFGAETNRFFPREVELALFGQIDPFARAEVRIEASESSPGAETTVSLAEANLTLLTLPYGFQAKLGQMRNRFGLTNVIHEHDLSFVDRPNVLRNFFGDEGLVEKGVEVTWVPDFLPFYLEALVGAFNGDNAQAFGYGRITQPLMTGRLRTFFELGDTSAIQLGISGANGQTADRLSSTILGYDVKYKYRPDGWLHPLLTLSSEGLYSRRRVEEVVEVETLVDTDGDGIPDTPVTNLVGKKSTRDAFGWYLQGEVQPVRRWAFGARYDASQFPDRPGFEKAIEPYVSFFPSEFLRFRLAYKHTDRDRTQIEGFNLNGATARTVNEVFFQASFILGAHPAHPF